MPPFTNKSLKPSPLLQYMRKRPFLMFGLPFISLMVASSFALQTFTQTRYDYHASKVQTMSWEEELGIKQNRKKIDLREEYYKLSNPALAEQSLDASFLPSAMKDDDRASTEKPAKPKKKKFSMSFTPQDELENKRVERPEGVPQWGAPAAEDAPVKGRRKEDRWV